MLNLVLQYSMEQHAEYLALADEAAQAVIAATDPQARERAETMHAFYMGALVASARGIERIRDAREEVAEQATARGHRA